MMCTKSTFLSLLLISSFSCPAWAEAPAALAGRRPSILLLLTDDQGYGDLSCHGNRILKTPILDRLHHEGVLGPNLNPFKEPYEKQFGTKGP
jgi:hypothetical protein